MEEDTDTEGEAEEAPAKTTKTQKVELTEEEKILKKKLKQKLKRKKQRQKKRFLKNEAAQNAGIEELDENGQPKPRKKYYNPDSAKNKKSAEEIKKFKKRHKEKLRKARKAQEAKEGKVKAQKNYTFFRRRIIHFSVFSTQ